MDVQPVRAMPVSPNYRRLAAAATGSDRKHPGKAILAGLSLIIYGLVENAGGHVSVMLVYMILQCTATTCSLKQGILYSNLCWNGLL